MKNLYILFILLAVFACQPAEKPTAEELFEVDKKFSQTAEEIGYTKAFIEYAHPDAVLLRDNNMPIVGISAIKEIYSGETPKNVHFSWEPLDGEVAISGDLGYTYGIYTYENDTIIEKGTYVSIWKKDEEGQWKYVLDSGNEGLGE